jgi:hypothetical protein
MKINIKNRDKIQAALDSVNGRAVSHVMSASDVSDIAARADRKLSESGIPIKSRRGVRAQHVPAGPGKSYARKGRHVVTNNVVLERGASGWFLVSCERVEIWADASEKNRIILTDGLADMIRENSMIGYVDP